MGILESFASGHTSLRRVSVVGGSHFQPALQEVCGGGVPGGVAFECMAELVPEPSNPHDPNAVKVCVDGTHVGYLSRSDAAAYRPQLDAMIARGPPPLCAAFIGRREDERKPNLGITLHFPAELVAESRGRSRAARHHLPA